MLTAPALVATTAPTVPASSWTAPTRVPGRIGKNDGDFPDEELPAELERASALIRYRGETGQETVVRMRPEHVAHEGGHRVGTGEDALAEAIRLSRHESAWEEIDMPALGVTAVMQATDGAYWIVPLLVNGGEDDEVGPASIDPVDGPTRQLWNREAGYSRPAPGYPTPFDWRKNVPTSIEVARESPNLVALVGIDSWTDLRRSPVVGG